MEAARKSGLLVNKEKKICYTLVLTLVHPL